MVRQQGRALKARQLMENKEWWGEWMVGLEGEQKVWCWGEMVLELQSC